MFTTIIISSLYINLISHYFAIVFYISCVLLFSGWSVTRYFCHCFLTIDLPYFFGAMGKYNLVSLNLLLILFSWQVGTPICIPSKEFIDIGRLASIENNHKPVDYAKKGQRVAIKVCNSRMKYFLMNFSKLTKLCPKEWNSRYGWKT